MATPKKSAFDILMNKTNRQKDTPTKKIIKINLDESVIIIKDDEDANKSIGDIQGIEMTNPEHNQAVTEAQRANYRDIYQHSHQYSDEERDFLKLLTTTSDLNLKSNLKYKPLESEYKPHIDYSTSYMNFSISTNSNKSECGCKHEDELDECSENIVFSVNNSIDNGEICEIKAKEELNESTAVKKEEEPQQTEGRPRRTLTKKSSSSSLLLKNPNAKRRRTDNNTSLKEVDEEKQKTKKSSSGDDEESVQMWTEKYQFKDENEIVTNKAQLVRLREWLNNWKIKHGAKAKDGNNNDSKSSGSESGSEYSCSDEDSSDDSASSTSKNRKGGKNKSYANAIILAGPHGCGKTSSVYIVAKQLGFKLFEVNASSLRSKSHIIQELEGALDSHHVSNHRTENNTNNSGNKKTLNNSNKEMRTSGSKINTFFKPSNQQPQKTAAETTTTTTTKRGGQVKRSAARRSNQGENNAPKSTVVNVHKESLILFDEIEVVFKEDVGFWSTVNHFVKRSKKPIVITTNDEFVQERLNLLNVERIEFERPRLDAAIRFLVSVAAREHSKLETSTAYEIVRECGCDMRKALVQLQALIEGRANSNCSSELIDKYKAESRNGTLDLDVVLSKCVFQPCSSHNQDAYFDRVFYLDGLVRRLVETDSSSTSSYSTCFKTYDKFLVKDGLTDNTATNHQLSQNSSNAAKLNLNVSINAGYNDKGSLSKYKTSTVSANTKDQLTEHFSTFITLFNENKATIGLSEWLRHGSVNRHNYASSTSIDRLAQSLAKFSSSRELALDYRPYLQCICQLEEAKQQVSARKRFLHYLNQTNIGLSKEDFALLARSSLIEKSPPKKETDIKPQLNMNRMDSNERLAALFFDAQLYDNN